MHRTGSTDRGRGRWRFFVAVGLATVGTLLASAGTASAEVLGGESTTNVPVYSPLPESTLVKTTASYDSGGGMTFDLTTAAPRREEEAGGGLIGTQAFAMLFDATGRCRINDFLLQKEPSVPFAELLDTNLTPAPSGEVSFQHGFLVELPQVTRTVSGATTTLSVTTDLIADLPFDCASVLLEGESAEGGASLSLMVFPISVPPPAPPAPTAPPAPAPTAPPAAAPAPTAPFLSIAKQKPLTLGVGRWKTVNLRVTNTGGTATEQGSLRVKTPKGVLVQPASRRLPLLAPGASWTVPFRVKLTTRAEKAATLSLTAVASGVTGTNSLVLEPKG